jgi:hypothetical protein
MVSFRFLRGCQRGCCHISVVYEGIDEEATRLSQKVVCHAFVMEEDIKTELSRDYHKGCHALVMMRTKDIKTGLRHQIMTRAFTTRLSISHFRYLLCTYC